MLGKMFSIDSLRMKQEEAAALLMKDGNEQVVVEILDADELDIISGGGGDYGGV